jgi:hypothetical protein
VKSLGIFWRDIAQNANALFMEQRLWGASRLWDHVADLFPNVQHIRGWSSEWTRPAFGLPLGSTPCPWPLLREVEGAELGSERFFERAVCHDRDVSFENAVRQIIIRPAFRFSWMSWCDPNEPFWFLDPIPERLSAENTNPCSLYKMNIFGLTPWLEELGLIFKYRPSLFLHGAPSRDAPLCGALAKEQIEGVLRWLMVKDLSNLKKLTFVYDKFAAEEGLGHVRLFLLNLAVGVESVKTWWLSHKNDPLPSVLRHCLLRLAWDPVIHQKDQVEALLSDLSEKTGIHMSLTDSAYESVSWTQFAYVERSDDQIAQRKSELLRREDLWRGGSCSRIFVLPS